MSTIRAVRAFLFAASLLLASLTLAACGGNSKPPSPLFTISVTVVNLAGTGGGLVLQDNSNDTLPVNANGTFMFTEAVTSGSAYNVTISAQPANPTQICGVANGSGIANADVTIQVNCGHNEWAWMKGPNTASTSNIGFYGTLGVASANNNPGGRQTPSTWTDKAGNFWLFGGFGFDSAGDIAPMNDLWEYNSGQWTWMGGSDLANQTGVYGTLGVPSVSNVPGARELAASWTDSSGNFWLFGGSGSDSAGNNGTLNDLWKYSSGQWTWMGGSALADQQGVYGTLGVASTNNVPGSRHQAASWTDSSGTFWLFGGLGYDSNGSIGQLNDLWKYSNGEWTWVSGSNLSNQLGIYGTQGISASANVPGSRNWAVGWADSSGDLWIFGGAGYGTSVPTGALNDLWRFSGGQWTWMAGSSLLNQPGVYGQEGIPASSNTPGSRQNPLGWTDSSGTLWLIGGAGMDSTGQAGLLNDVWKFSNGEWTWVTGSKLVNQNGVYGTQGMLAAGNIPGARFVAVRWVDANGNVWLFGGYGVSGGTEGDLSDLWMYMP